MSNDDTDHKYSTGPQLTDETRQQWSTDERRNGGAVGWEFVDLVVSVIELGDRPDDEQRHVRQQVRDE